MNANDLIKDVTIINLGILFVSGYIIYRKRREFKTVPKNQNVVGVALAAVFFLLSLYTGGFLNTRYTPVPLYLPEISALFAIASVWGVCYAAWGKHIAKLLLFPIGYTSLCIVNYWLIGYTTALSILVVTIAEVFLNGMGIPVTHDGAVIFSNSGHGFGFLVADECSGFRSLVAIMALSAGYAHFTLPTLWKKWTLFTLSIPIALLANAVRVISLLLFAKWFGQGLAISLWHDIVGWLVYLIAISLLISTTHLLADANPQGAWKRFSQANQKKQ